MTIGTVPTINIGQPLEPIRYVFNLMPRPKDRPRSFVAGGRVVNTTTPRTRWYENQIMQGASLQHPFAGPLEGDLWIIINFTLPTRVHGDLDNLAKSVLDGMQGVAFKNDKQIKALSLAIFFDKKSTGQIEVIIQHHNSTPPEAELEVGNEFEE